MRCHGSDARCHKPKLGEDGPSPGSTVMRQRSRVKVEGT